MTAKYFLLFFSVVAMASVVASCGDCSKKIDCPAYNDTVLNNFFPYVANQQLVFKTSTGETVSMTLRNTETSEPYQAVGSAYGGTPSCDARKVFQSDETDTANRSLFHLTLNLTDGYRNAELLLGRNRISFVAQRDTGFTNISLNNSYAPPVRQSAVTLNNRNFTNVTVAMRDTSNNKLSGIYKIYHTKAEGLVGYAEYPSLKTWVKQ